MSTHNGSEIQNMCSNDLPAALTGRNTPGAALRDAQQQADRLLIGTGKSDPGTRVERQ